MDVKVLTGAFGVLIFAIIFNSFQEIVDPFTQTMAYVGLGMAIVIFIRLYNGWGGEE